MWISRGYIEHLADADAAGLVVGPSLTRTSLNAVIASQVPEASTSIAGRVRLADVADAVEGTAQNLAVTPAGLAAAWEVLHAHGTYTHTNEDWEVQFSTLVRDRDEVRFSLKLTGVRQVTSPATKHVLGTIPASFAPSAILFAPVLVRAGTNWFTEHFEVRPSGEVVLDQQTQFTLGGTSQMHASVIFKTA